MVVSITVLERVTYQLSVLPWLMRFCLSHFNLTKFWKHISLTNEHACGNVVFAEDQYLRVWITDIRQTTLLPFILLPSSISLCPTIRPSINPSALHYINSTLQFPFIFCKWLFFVISLKSNTWHLPCVCVDRPPWSIVKKLPPSLLENNMSDRNIFFVIQINSNAIFCLCKTCQFSVCKTFSSDYFSLLIAFALQSTCIRGSHWSVSFYCTLYSSGLRRF